MACDACAPAHAVGLQSPGDLHAVTRDEDEFSALVQRQARFVFRVAYAVLLNPHDAEDAVQETFLKLYRNGGWRQATDERAFLARTAWRAAVDARRRVSSRTESTIELLGAQTFNSPSPEPGPEAILLTAGRNALVHSLIDALPEELRVPLVLASHEELNSREIAGILGIPEGTVRTRLQRARQVLRRKLAVIEEARYA